MLLRGSALLLVSFLNVSDVVSDSVSSKLLVNIPNSLNKAGGYDHREALFGIPPYGGSIAQNVYYADSDLCDPNVDTRKGFPTREKDATGKQASWPSPFILMVDRGGCTFVKKVRNAQRSGAAGVIIADNTCLCSDADCMAVNSAAAAMCESAEPIMADDGSGADISIPSFLMFKHDADKIKAEVKNNGPVQVSMAWSLPNPDDRVEYDLWTVPTDVVSRDFLSNFKVVAQALGDKAYFTPHMYIYDGIKSHCQGNDHENFCYTLCTNNGRYCATDPDNDLDKGISGADVVTESLRRLCVWNHYGASDGVGEVWWDYVTEFQARCNTPDYFSNIDCIKDAYKNAKVDEDMVDRCMADSGGLTKDGSNAFLDLEISSQATRGVVVVPTAFVNTAAIRGALTVTNIFDAICAGFAEGSTPDICNKCSRSSDALACIKSGGKKGWSPSAGSQFSGGNDSSKISTHTFFLTLLLVVGVAGSFAVYYKKKTQDDMRDQVRGILAEYMPLQDDDDGAGGPGGGGMMMSNPMGFQRPGTSSLIG